MTARGESDGKLNVLVTGASGTIGELVREYLGGQYNIHCLTRTPQEFPSFVGDISDFEAIRPAFDGMDAVIHLAASAAVDTPWDDILRNNLVGMYNAIEAARQAGVQRFVFASSNHAIGMYEIEGAPDLFELDDPRVYDHTVEVRPDSLYGVSKVYGEALGRYYHDVFGMRVYCLRIGAVRADDAPFAPENLPNAASHIPGLTLEQRRKRMRAAWLSRRDCAHLIERCLLVEDTTWAVVYGISNNPRQYWDIQHAREVLGYEPQDSAPL